MRSVFAQSLAFMLLACIPPFAACAREIEAVDYQQRFDESALVVIATPTAKTADTKETSLGLHLFRNDLDGKQVPISAVGVETPFNVSVVLKGDKAVKQFTLHHYRLSDEVPLVNSPLLFTTGDIDLQGQDGQQERHSYLLFLIREADGRYAPAGGQLDPAYEAIFPLPFEKK